MDTFAALALATEPPHDRLLLRQPHNREEYIISGVSFLIFLSYFLENAQAYYILIHFLMHHSLDLHIRSVKVCTRELNKYGPKSFRTSLEEWWN